MANTYPASMMSLHAVRRCQQRGIKGTVLAALLSVADRFVPVGGDRIAISLSRRGAAFLRKNRHIAGDVLDRIGRVTIIMDTMGMIITVLHATIRHYRHGRN